jgi:hypothetical protein
LRRIALTLISPATGTEVDVTVSRKGQLLLALIAVASSVLAIALASAPAAHAGTVPCIPGDPGCISFPFPALATLTVTPPASGRVTSDATVPSINCSTDAAAICSGSVSYLCLTGPASCATFAPTVTLTASGGPSGKVPQWSSNCAPASSTTCAVKLDAAPVVTLAWVDPPPQDPPATTTTTPSNTQQQQPQQQPTVTPAKAECKVPKLKGKTLDAAKKALKKANCATGTVKRKKVKRGKTGRVIAQSVKAGTTKVAGAKVGLTVSRHK